MYASIAAHARADYCRADDIESWFYTLVDMYTGKLPWTHVTSERRVSFVGRRGFGAGFQISISPFIFRQAK